MRLGKRGNVSGSRSKRNKKSSQSKGILKSQIGPISPDLITSVFLPKIEKLATQSIEKYAQQSYLYDEAARSRELLSRKEGAKVEIDNDGTIITNQSTYIPLKKPLFYSENVLQDFISSVLIETSDHFFSEKGGWRVQARAAKFDRLLDAKYGLFRPFVTNYPEIDHFIRAAQRKYATGYFSPFRQTPLPISKANAVVLLFMIHRGKTPWQITLLATLFLLVGLQPWALVCSIVLIQILVVRRQRRVVGKMKKRIPLTKSYYRLNIPENSSINPDFDFNKHKQDILQRPVGVSIDEICKKIDVTDVSKFDIIMIGGGPTALYTAALLSRAGRKVLVLCPQDDASGCLTMKKCESDDGFVDLQTVPFDVECCNISKINRQQQLMAPALCSETDYQGGIRFARIGCEADGYAFELLSIPGMVPQSSDQQPPFVMCGMGALHNLMYQAADILGDGVPDTDGHVGQSVTGSYVQACEAINATSSAYYLSKILPESVNKLRSSTSYQDCSLRHVSSFLNNVFPLNAYTRSLMAAVGMKTENIRPCATSMAAHVTNVCSTLCPEGMHYPIGGPRALSNAFATVVEQSGGLVVTCASVSELVFDESIHLRQRNQNTNKDVEDGPPPPCCVGLKLSDGRMIRFAKSRYDGSKDLWPLVVSLEGFIHTFIRLLSDDIRTKYKVPRGLPALSERRPVMHILFALRGTAGQLNLAGADFFRLPGAAVAQDELDKTTGAIKHGEIGLPDDDVDSVSDVKKRRHVKFTSGSSWMHVSFPSAKDPSFESRHGEVSTCVVTVEADDDFVVPFDTKPKIYVRKTPTVTSSDDLTRMLERVKKDLLYLYPQLEGKILHAEVQGPYQRGLRQNPERFAAKGIRPETSYPGLFVGGNDITVDTFSGSMVAGWLLANAVSKYQVIDFLLLQKNITSDIEQFLEPLFLNEEDVAVPWDFLVIPD